MYKRQAQKIFAEQGAEDELRRIVLVNLARLSVAGEWTGLTSAGGSSGVIGAFPDLSSFSPTAGGEILETSTLQPTNFYQASNKTLSSFESYYYYFPIVVNTEKTYTTVGFLANTAATSNTLTVAIYDSADDTHLPQTKLASAAVSMAATGIRTASLTVEAGQSMALTKGQLVWAAIKYTAGSDNTRTVRCTDEFDQYNLGINNTSGSFFAFNSIVANTIPATFAASDFVSTFSIEPPVLVWSCLLYTSPSPRD